MNDDSIKIKALILIGSTLLASIGIALYFLDTSMAWSGAKTFSCIIINLWVFFMPAALRGSYCLNKDRTLAEWFLMGFHVGLSGIALPVLFAPFYGIKYYLQASK